ncbi:MAG: TonB family protein [Verrucomicrobia bacterium]|nr:TonB family protein [Verrucomicrobiota bacterium]
MRRAVLGFLSGLLLALPLSALAAPTSETPLDPSKASAGRYRLPFPDYPVAARRKGAEALMIVDLQVDATGRIVDAQVRDYVGDRSLTEHAARFARTRWRAIVRTRAGRPVPYRVGVPVVFVLNSVDRVNALVRKSKNPRLREIPFARSAGRRS